MTIAKKCRSGAGSRRAQPANPSRHFPMLDALEPRLFLSAAPNHHRPHYFTHRPFAHHVHRPQPIQPEVAHVAFPAHKTRAANGAASTVRPLDAQPDSTFAPAGLTPAQIRTAYGINSINFGSIAGDGAGQTIAIVTAYHAPTIESDLASFDAAFGIPAPPSFIKVAQDGSTNYPGVDPAGPGTMNWELETALDVQWSHAIAPAANILLVECDNDTFDNLILGGVDFARH